ncbi:MAG TPA: GNAT family N-acetyltransferase [Acetobacteraceae bacterium]|nr:GNAT family N-acetyltransferase [Acetobacteraceae bacterium]
MNEADPMAGARPVVRPRITVESVTEFTPDDLNALCEAANAAIIDGGGFGWINPPEIGVLASYFRGVLLVPERELFVGRLDGVIVASAQLVLLPRNNEAQRFSATLTHAFTAPYARGHGIGRMLVRKAEERARMLHRYVLNLDVRETQEAAIRLYESMGFERWGVHPAYARVRGQTVRGFFYCKLLGRRGRASAETGENNEGPGERP